MHAHTPGPANRPRGPFPGPLRLISPGSVPVSAGLCSLSPASQGFPSSSTLIGPLVTHSSLRGTELDTQHSSPRRPSFPADLGAPPRNPKPHSPTNHGGAISARGPWSWIAVRAPVHTFLPTSLLQTAGRPGDRVPHGVLQRLTNLHSQCSFSTASVTPSYQTS